MFIGSTVIHKKYGEGIITDLNIRPENELSSIITVNFNSGEVKKFAISMFVDDKFCNIVSLEDEKAISYISALKEEYDKKEIEKREQRKKILESKIYVPSYNLNEVEKEVSKEDWEKAFKVAESYRFPNESRAVVMDSDLVFINAATALRYIEAREKDGDKLYKSCDLRNKRFMGHHWSYASKDNIRAIINKLEEVNDVK